MANPLSEVAGSLFGGAWSGLFWVLVFLGIAGGMFGTIYYLFFYRKKFDIMIEVKSERSQDPKLYFDKGGIFYDKKDKTKYLKLLATKVSLEMPPFKIMQHTNRGDFIRIWRKSEDEFLFLTPGKINREQVIRANGRLYRIAETEHRQMEADAYWYITRKDKVKKLLDPESLLMKLLPYIPHIVGGMFLVFIIYIVMGKLPGMIDQITELARVINSAGQGTVTPA
jgi:hypothetical protein